MKSIRKADPRPSADADSVENFWIKARDVNNYKVGLGDNYDATEESFLRITEAIDAGRIVYASPGFCRKYIWHMNKLTGARGLTAETCITYGDVPLPMDFVAVELGG